MIISECRAPGGRNAQRRGFSAGLQREMGSPVAERAALGRGFKLSLSRQLVLRTARSWFRRDRWGGGCARGGPGWRLYIGTGVSISAAAGGGGTSLSLKAVPRGGGCILLRPAERPDDRRSDFCMGTLLAVADIDRVVMTCACLPHALSSGSCQAYAWNDCAASELPTTWAGGGAAVRSGPGLDVSALVGARGLSARGRPHGGGGVEVGQMWLSVIKEIATPRYWWFRAQHHAMVRQG
jgi:hypothetical protein